jgi:ubiquinone biosynthesis protein
LDFQSLSRLGRFKDIVVVLAKYGFNDLVQRLDVPGIQWVEKITHAERGLGTYERMRHALEDLGPTFVKFGQIMSLRPDLLPAPLLKELSKLQDEVPPVPRTEIETVIEESFGSPLDEVFTIFDAEPIAAASLSQVHRGVLKDMGLIVCAKIQRPGIRKKIQRDLDIMAAIAERLHERSEDLQVYDLPNLVRVTRKNLMRELDFLREARNMKIARAYASDTDIYVPEVYDSHCSERILVMEYMLGTKLKDMDPSRLEDPETLAKQGLEAAIKQIFEDGFFHADPHPGNLLITEQKGLCLLDWGMAGRLTEKDRYELIDLLKAVVDKDSDAMLHAVLRMSSEKEAIDTRSLERDLLDILDSYYAVPIKDLNMGQLLLAVTSLLRQYRLKLPPDLVIMVKALVTAEGTARQIYPDLDVISEAKDQVGHLAVSRLSPKVLWRQIQTNLSSLLSAQRELPRRLNQIIDKLERGQLSLRFRHENLEGLLGALENASNRLTLGVIIGALIVGSSMIITTGIGPLLLGFPALGVVGYFISGILGLWLIFTILRTRKY